MNYTKQQLTHQYGSPSIHLLAKQLGQQLDPKSLYTKIEPLNVDGNTSYENTGELNPMATSSQSTCNQFKCSSGECLSWLRICDGLYDCSSHDDEKDCHK